jgi:membrane protein implicated in regulation of membrane protease activity
MDAAAPVDRIIGALLLFFGIVALLAIAYWRSTVREKDRATETARLLKEDRAFWSGLAAQVVDAVRAEGVARVKAENERLYRPVDRPSDYSAS